MKNLIIEGTLVTKTRLSIFWNLAKEELLE